MDIMVKMKGFQIIQNVLNLKFTLIRTHEFLVEAPLLDFSFISLYWQQFCTAPVIKILTFSIINRVMKLQYLPSVFLFFIETSYLEIFRKMASRQPCNCESSLSFCGWTQRIVLRNDDRNLGKSRFSFCHMLSWGKCSSVMLTNTTVAKART